MKGLAMGPPRLAPVHRHLKHHARFYLSLAIGIAVWIVTAPLADSLQLAAAGDSFYAVYLVWTAAVTPHLTANALRQRATYEDEGKILITLITLGAVVLSLWLIFSLINAERQPDLPTLVLAIASVPLGWLTLHTVAAYHYAHHYYTRVSANGASRDTGGLDFPGTPEPTALEFYYHSFSVGMAAQVSDVQVLTTSMRRLTTAHAIVSFFFNTVLVALAVNLIVSQGR
jgi:uncharacterized membrane protein